MHMLTIGSMGIYKMYYIVIVGYHIKIDLNKYRYVDKLTNVCGEKSKS